MRVKLGGQKYAKAKYDRTCLELPKEVVEERKARGESYIVRMKVPNGKTQFKDIVHGKVVFDNKDIDD
jgi:glutamyl/glutaminyl-tRNA synthetase